MTGPELDNLLTDVTARLRSAFDPVAIYLYGSFAYGQPGEDSDLDLLIVVAESDESFFRRSARAYEALRGIGVPIDVQVYTRDEFEPRASLPVSFERTVRQKGRMLYAA